MPRILFLIIVFIAFGKSKIQGQSVGGVTSGSAVFCDTINSGFISLTGHNGSILYWEYSVNNGTTWNVIPNITSTQSYYNLKISTSYRAIVKDGSFPQDTSTVSKITVNLPGMAGVLSGGGIFCNSSGNGTLTLNGSSGNVQYWQKSINSGVSWTNIANTSTVLPYTPIVQNTLFRVIVQTSTVCPADTSGTASVKIDPFSVAGLLAKKDSVCFGSNNDTLKLSAFTGTVSGWIYSNNNGSTWNSISNNTPLNVYNNLTSTTIYKTIVKSGICPADTTAPLIIYVYPKQIVSAGPDKTIIRHESTVLNGIGTGNVLWSPAEGLSDIHSLSPTASPINSTNFVLTITDSHQCTQSDTVFVSVEIPLPNAITPNNDGLNDYFFADKIMDFPNNTFTVYNRWGNKVYEQKPYINDWYGKSLNGQDLPDDTYFYVLDYGNGEKAKTGTVLIKR